MKTVLTKIMQLKLEENSPLHEALILNEIIRPSLELGMELEVLALEIIKAAQAGVDEIHFERKIYRDRIDI